MILGSDYLKRLRLARSIRTVKDEDASRYPVSETRDILLSAAAPTGSAGRDYSD
jgi:hypothetical protein